MKLAKALLLGLAGLLALVLLAAGAALVVVDGEFVKARLEKMMKEKNRTLVIEGVPSVRFFPVAGIALGKTSLSEPGGGKPFASLDAAEIAVSVMPLFSNELAIETLKLSGLKANLVRRKDGSLNISDLQGLPEKDPKPRERPVLRIAEVDVGKVQIFYHDEASGQEIGIAELSLKTGRLDGQIPGDVALSLRIAGKRPEVDLQAKAAGALSFNLRRDQFAFDKFTAQLRGRLDQETIAAEFAAPKVQVSREQASGSAIKGTLQVKGPQRGFDLSYTLSLSGPPLAADLAAKLDGASIQAKIEVADLSPLKAKFDFNADQFGNDLKEFHARVSEILNPK